MSVSEELMTEGTATSDSFWELDCYKRTVKRLEDGHKLCSDLMKMLNERAELEKTHAKNLRSWASRWEDSLRKGPEYGTTEEVCIGLIREAESIAELHTQVRDSLIAVSHNQIKAWRDEHYKKPLMGQCKQTKGLEDSFRKAQKPWSKLFTKVIKTKKEYHTACKVFKSAENSLSNAQADSSLSEDHKRRLSDKVDKSRKDVDISKEKYELALKDLNGYTSRYIEDMTTVFDGAQKEEKERLDFVRHTLADARNCLNLSENDKFRGTYDTLAMVIESADSEMDLRWWSQHHGVDMPMNWPTFEEYSPDMHSISRKDKKSVISGSDGITMTSIKPAQNNTDYCTQSNVPEQPTSTPSHIVQHQNQQPTIPQQSSTQGTPFE